MPQEHYQRVHAFSSMPVIHPALFFDDCSGTMNWESSGDGDDYVVEYDPAAAFVQTNGLLLKTRATDPATSDVLNAYRRLWLPPRGVLRLQALFSFITLTPSVMADFILTWNDGDVAHDTGVTIAGHNGACGYASGYAAADYVWTWITGWKAGIIANAWNKIDFSINLNTGFYHRIQINEHVLDGSDIPIFAHDLVLEKHMHLLLRARTSDPVQGTLYVDQILLTQESP